jgi:TolB-like protein/Tfp pilus assembly protein PilF
MQPNRQLAAIMFTDIVGYTALMGDDEDKAFKLLRQNREMQQPLIKQFNGNLIKETGDGILASFSTVTDAVFCAIAIQQSCNEILHLQLRIGIHLGEVLFQSNDVFGDGVNIASRIEALAPVASIWISEPVYNNISNKKDIRTKFVQTVQLKNVKEMVRIYEVITDASERESKDTHVKKNTHKTVSEKSIAVLPFVNMSNDPEQEYFSDGIAEEIINSLVHLQDLKVAGRLSSFRFKGNKVDLRDVGNQLGVRTVLEGSVRKHGNKVRITAQLVNVNDGYYLWSERYDRDMDDIFAIQDEIALSITEKLKVTLRGNDRDIITKSYTQNTHAYQLFLQGRFHINRRGASILTGIQLFQKAIEEDPDFALAYSGLADALTLSANYGLVPPTQVMPKAKQLAEKALMLAPDLPEPHCSLGYYYTSFEWNWEEAKKNFYRAIELNPRYSQAHSWYGWNYLSWVEGNFSEAEIHGKLAIKEEPLSAIAYATYSLILHASGKFQESLELCNTGIELDANSFLCHLNRANCYMLLEQYDKAISSYETAIKISRRHHFAVNGLIWTYCMAGDLGKAQQLMDELKERSSKEYIGSTFTGLSAGYMGNVELAFEFLEKAFAQKEALLLSLKHQHWVPEILKEDARFINLLERINYPK